MRGENVEPLDDLGSLVCVICKTSQAGALWWVQWEDGDGGRRGSGGGPPCYLSGYHLPAWRPGPWNPNSCWLQTRGRQRVSPPPSLPPSPRHPSPLCSQCTPGGCNQESDLIPYPATAAHALHPTWQPAFPIRHCQVKYPLPSPGSGCPGERACFIFWIFL